MVWNMNFAFVSVYVLFWKISLFQFCLLDLGNCQSKPGLKSSTWGGQICSKVLKIVKKKNKNLIETHSMLGWSIFFTQPELFLFLVCFAFQFHLVVFCSWDKLELTFDKKDMGKNIPKKKLERQFNCRQRNYVALHLSWWSGLFPVITICDPE